MPRVSLVWRYFTREDQELKTAKCKACGNLLSYKTTVSNLKSHLRQKHVEVYEDLMKITECDVDSDDATSDIERYFEKCPGGVARCTVCSTVVSMDQLRIHLVEEHPKIIEDTDDESFEMLRDRVHGEDIIEADYNNPDDDDETKYTEVMYLDENFRSADNDIFASTTKNKTEKRKRRQSRTDVKEENIRKKIKTRTRTEDDDEVDEELQSFLVYIKSLLKNVPKDVCGKLQMDIVHLVMSVKLKLSLSPDKQSTVNDSFFESKNVFERIPVTIQNVTSPGTYLVVPDNSKVENLLDSMHETQQRHLQPATATVKSLVNIVEENGLPHAITVTKDCGDENRQLTLSDHQNSNSHGQNSLSVPVLNVSENIGDSNSHFEMVNTNISGIHISHGSTVVAQETVSNSGGTVSNNRVQRDVLNTSIERTVFNSNIETTPTNSVQESSPIKTLARSLASRK